tara:strand:- start:49 stop:2253 length:2205 start_codon:yes stop_codon:yes gene_type:complete
VAENTIYLKNQEKIIKLTEEEDKLKKSIAAEAKKIAEAAKNGKEVSQEELRNLKLKLKVKQDEKKITQQIGNIHEEIADEMSTEQLLSFDISKNLKNKKKIDEDIAKLKMSGNKEDSEALEVLQKRKATMDELLKTTIDEAAQAQATQQTAEKTLETLGMSVSSLKGMKDQAILFGRALMANPYMLLLAGFALLIMYLKDTVSFSMKLSKELGVSVGQAAKLNNEIGFVRRKFLDMVGIDISAISNQLLEDFGDVNMLSGMTVQQIGTMALGMGTTGQNLVKVSKTMQSVLPSISTSADAMYQMGMFAAIAKENGAATGKVMDDLADNTEVFASFGKDGGENIAMAAIQARKLGLNLSQTAKIADSLLDFESSIEKEMEASLLIGKQLNYNRARQLALEGDIAGAAAEVMDQIGGQEEFSRLNVIQRRALAESIGVSVDELSRLASGNLNVSSDATEPMDAVAEGQKMLSDAMGGLDKTLAVTNFGLKGISKYLAKRNQAKIAAEATEKAVTKGIPKALETLAKGPKNLDGSPNKKFKSNKQAIETLSKELGAESAEAIGKKAVTKKVTEKVVQETVEQGSKLGLKATIGKVPVLSLITGAVFAGKEIMQGDFVGAGMEIASGVSATLGALSFGAGTGISYGIDGAILARELYQASQTLTKLEEDLNKEIQTLNAEDQAKVAAAMQGTEEQLMEFIKANDSWFGKSGNQLDNVAELLQKILNEQKSLPTNMTKE